MNKKSLSHAIDYVGGQVTLAKLIGTSQAQISYWLTKSKRGVPAEWAGKIEDATGGVVTRHELRPDLFPPEEQRAAV